MQLQHSEGVESGGKRDAYKESLAKSYIANSRSADALGLLRELPQHTEHAPRILCLIADAQVALGNIAQEWLSSSLLCIILMPENGSRPHLQAISAGNAAREGPRRAQSDA